MTMRAITADVVSWPARNLRALQVRVRHQPSNGASAWQRNLLKQHGIEAAQTLIFPPSSSPHRILGPGGVLSDRLLIYDDMAAGKRSDIVFPKSIRCPSFRPLGVWSGCYAVLGSADVTLARRPGNARTFFRRNCYMLAGDSAPGP